MTRRNRRISDAGGRVRNFIGENIGAFGAIPLVQTLLDTLVAALVVMGDLGEEKVTDTGAARGATIERGDLRMLLDDAMREIANDWRRMWKRLGDNPNKFRIPYGSDELRISTGRSFHDLATPIRDQFTAIGYPSDFLDNLQTLTDSFEESIGESEDSRRERIGTNAAFIDPARTVVNCIEDFDPIVKRVFKGNTRMLAEWMSASHIERPKPGDDNEEPPQS